MPANGMRTMKRTPGVSALGVLLSALLLLAGCGGGSSTSHPSDTKPVPPSTSPATTSPPTATTLPPGVSLTAQVTAPLAGVYDDRCHSIPLAHQIQRISERWLTSKVYPGDTARGQAFVHLDDLVDVFSLAVERRERVVRQ